MRIGEDDFDGTGIAFTDPEGDTMHKDPVMLLVMFKDHEKVAEQDITNFTAREMVDLLLTQNKQGRSWGYQLTSKEEMKERREGR